MTTPDPIRAALERLQEYDDADPYHGASAILAAARAALAAAPLDRPPAWLGLIHRMADELDHNRQCLLDDRSLTHPLADRARAALAAAPPDGPAVPEGREPAAVIGEPSDQELKAAYWEAYRETAMCGAEASWLAGLRAVAGLGRPTAPPAPAAGEVAETIADLRECADSCILSSKGYWAEPMRRAADLLEQLSMAAQAPQPVAGEGVEALAARPLLEQVAAIGDCISEQTVGRVRVLADRASAWLAENPPSQPVAIEPRGCPMPGACSCVELPTPAAGEPPAELVEQWMREASDQPPGPDARVIAALAARWGAAQITERRPAPAPDGEVGRWDAELKEHLAVEWPSLTMAASQPAPAPDGEVGPSDDDLALVYHDCCGGCELMDQGGFEDAARAVLARWGRPAAPPTPAAGELGEVAQWLRETGQLLSRRPDIQCRVELRLFERAAALLEQLSAQAPQPVAVPVSERLPGTGDCDAEGQVWVSYEPSEWRDTTYWELMTMDNAMKWAPVAFWLPAHALPLPTTTPAGQEGADA